MWVYFKIVNQTFPHFLGVKIRKIKKDLVGVRILEKPYPIWDIFTSQFIVVNLVTFGKCLTLKKKKKIIFCA